MDITPLDFLDISNRIKQQANCLEQYAEQNGFLEKPIPSVFHIQASHFRDLGNELATLSSKTT
mgnify:CR=1 FL=1